MSEKIDDLFWNVGMFIGLSVLNYLMWAVVNFDLNIGTWYWLTIVFAGILEFMVLAWCSVNLIDDWRDYE